MTSASSFGKNARQLIAAFEVPGGARHGAGVVARGIDRDPVVGSQ